MKLAEGNVLCPLFRRDVTQTTDCSPPLLPPLQVPISELCDKHGLQPTVFYRWQKEFFENGTAAFQTKARPNHSAEQERIDYLEKKIQTKDEVLAEWRRNTSR